MVYPRRHDDQILLLEPDPDPIVPLVPHVKVPCAVQYVPDLLVLVQVLVEEHLDLVLVRLAHGLGRHGDLVAVLVAALRGDGVDVGDGGTVLVDDAERAQGFGGDGAAGVVGLALVAGEVVEPVGLHFRRAISFSDYAWVGASVVVGALGV